VPSRAIRNVAKDRLQPPDFQEKKWCEPLEIFGRDPILNVAQAVAPAPRRAACFDLFARGTADGLERVGRFVFLLLLRRKWP